MIESKAGASTLIDFSRYISDRTQNFTGRKWVFQAINDWLANPEAPRFFLITGEPGSGKTAISSKLYQFSTGEVSSPDKMTCLKRGFLDAVHFCSSADDRWINPKTFTESLAKQLAELYPIYRNALLEKSGDRKVSADIDVSMQNVTAGGDVTGVKISVNLGSASARDGFDRTVREPLEELYRQSPTQQIIILVDALDESLSNKEKEMTNIADLITKSQYLPANVRFILTLRPETGTLRELRRNQPKPEEISLTSGIGLINTGKDIREHVLKVLPLSQDLANKLASDLPPDILADTIQLKSEGNFLYVKYLIDMLKDEEKDEKITAETLNNFPDGLDEIYIEFLDRLTKNKGQAVEVYLSVLGILTVSQEALTEGQISNFVRMDKEKVRRLLTSLRQLLDADESILATQRSYSIYHRSFSEFLLDANRAEDYWCGEAFKLHQRIIEHYETKALSWDKADWTKVDNYGLLYLASHLYAAINNIQDKSTNKYLQDLYELICKPFMQEKLLRFGARHSFYTDIELAVRAFVATEKTSALLHEVRIMLLYTGLPLFGSKIPTDALGILFLLDKHTEILEIVMQMQDILTKNNACLDISLTLIQHREIEKARHFLEQALKPYESMLRMVRETRETAVWDQIVDNTMDLAAVFARVGDIEQAVALANTIEDDSRKVHTMRNIARAAAMAGKKSEAAELTSRILSITSTSEDPKVETSLLEKMELSAFRSEGGLIIAMEVAKTLTELGRFEEALSIAEQEGWAEPILDDIVQSLDNVEDIDILSKVAMLLAKAGRKIEAENLASKVLRIIESSTNESKKAMLLEKEYKELTETLRLEKNNTASLPDIDKWIAINKEIQSQYKKAEKVSQQIQREIIGKPSSDTDWDMIALEISDRLLALLELINKSKSKLDRIVESLTKQEDFEKILTIVKSNHPQMNLQGFEKGQLLTMIHDDLNQIKKDSEGVLNNALVLADLIGDEGWKAFILSKVAILLAKAGKREQAENLADRALNSVEAEMYQLFADTGEQMLKALAYNLAREGKLEYAMAISDSTRINSTKALILGAIVRAMSELGRQRESEVAANKLLEITNRIMVGYDRAYGRLRGQVLTWEERLPTWGIGIGNWDVRDSSSYHTEELLGVAAVALSWAGQVDRALELVERISYGDEIVKILGDMASALFKTNKPQQAVIIANIALTMLDLSYKKQSRREQFQYQFRTPSDYSISLYRGYTIMSVVRRIAHVLAIDDRDLNRIINMTMTIHNASDRAFGLSFIARGLAQALRFDRALELAELIEDADAKVLALCNIVQALDMAEKKEQALILANKALDMANSSGGEMSDMLHKLSNAAAALCKTNIFDEPVKRSKIIVKSYEDFFDRVEQMWVTERRDLKYSKLWELESSGFNVICSGAQDLAEIGDYDTAISLWRNELKKVYLNNRNISMGYYFREFRKGEAKLEHQGKAKQEQLFELIRRGVQFIGLVDKGRTLWKMYGVIIDTQNWWKKKSNSFDMAQP